jgi:broad specificity phosphatase PhoE
MLRLFFVRHGRTSWNAQGRVQGGGGLDEIGRAQAAALGQHLRNERFDAIYASPALRARQTAQAVARHHDMRVQQRHLLHDMDYGKFAGALLEEVRRDHGDLFEQWRTHPHLVQFEGGENLGDLRRRISGFVDRIVKLHPTGTVLVATHDSPVRMITSLARGLDDSHHNDADLKTSLASVTILEADAASITLRDHNDVRHLQGIDDGF